MAGNAVIGALRVALGLDSAQFETGLKQTQAGLSKWQAFAVGAFAAVAVAGAAAAVSLGKAMGEAIDRFDEMGKAAQKVGLSVEALSRLEYAARLSDVSLETLSTGLTRLSNNMAQIAQGTGQTAAYAFAAIGVSATEASGKLRSANDVLADVADRFAALPDGAEKTAIAVQLFGRSGAELIPMLNMGREGLKELADEADRLGITLDTKATKNAERFNDNLTRVQAAMEGVVNRITEAALPVLTYLSEKFVEAAGNGDLLETFANGFVITLKAVVSAAAIATTSIATLGEGFSTLMNAARLAQGGNFEAAFAVLNHGFGNIKENVSATLDFVNGLWAAIELPPEIENGPLVPFTVDMDAFKSSADAAKAAAALLKQEMAEGAQVYLATRDPLESLQMELDRLGHLLNKGAIDWDTYGRAVNAAMLNVASQALGVAGQISGALAGLFKDNKAFAVANAVINTAEGVTKALAQGGIWGFAGAAAVAASGAAQIASILSAQPGTASAPTVSQPAIADQAALSGPAISISLEGNRRYTRDEVVALIEGINEYFGDRGQINSVVAA